jgi:hypothetical protein
VLGQASGRFLSVVAERTAPLSYSLIGTLLLEGAFPPSLVIRPRGAAGHLFERLLHAGDGSLNGRFDSAFSVEGEPAGGIDDRLRGLLLAARDASGFVSLERGKLTLGPAPLDPAHGDPFAAMADALHSIAAAVSP